MNIKLCALRLIFAICVLRFAFSQLPAAQAVDCTVPISGNMTVSSSCSFPGTTNGVDAGTGTTNTAALTVGSGATLTISSGQTVATGTLNPSTGSIAVVSGGQIKIGQPLWMYDADADGYSSVSTMAAQLIQEAGFRRRNLMTSMTTRDCRDFYNSGITCDPATMNMTDGYFNGAWQEASGQPGLAYKELPSDNSTVGLWHINNAWTDASGNSNTLTAAGNAAFTTSSKLGSHAATFDGTGDYASISDNALLSVGNIDFTIETWVYLNNKTGNQYFVAKDSGAAGGREYGVYYNSTADRFRFYVFNSSESNDQIDADTLGSPSASTWYHIAAWHNATSSEIGISINGSLVNTKTSSVDPRDGTALFVIGAADNGTTGFLNGYVDEVRMSKVTRTPEEIKAAAQRRPYASYIGPVNDLGQTPGSWSQLNLTAKGVQTAGGETPISTSSLVAAWNFNSTSGTTATADAGSCGASCNGTLTNFASTASQDQAAGTGWTSANRRWGAGALMFDGSNDYVNLGDFRQVTSTFSIEAWLYPTKGGVGQTFINKRYGGSNSIMVRIATGNTISLEFCNATCDNGPGQSNTALSIGSWNHYVGIYDASAGTASIYINGKLDKQVTGVGTGNIVYDTYGMYIGAQNAGGAAPGSTSAFFNGTIDSTRIYSRALSAAEVLANYQAGNIEFQTRTSADNATWEAWRPVTSEASLDSLDTISPIQKISTTSLTAYWKLDETSGTRADSKGSNTLTDNNTVTYAPGRLKNAGQFTRANSEYLSVLDNSDMSVGDIDFSFNAWVYPTNSTAAMDVLSKYNYGANQREYYLAYEAGTFVFGVSPTGQPSSAVTVQATGFSTINTWYSVTIWHDATNNNINLQINNGTVNSTSHSTGVFDGTSDFTIGKLQSSGDFDGRIDEVAFWKRTLTAAERTRLFEDGLDLHGAGSGRLYRSQDTTLKVEGTGSERVELGAPQVDASTVALWHLEETSNNAGDIKDSSPNAYNMTPQSAPPVTDGFYGKTRDFDGTADYLQSVAAGGININNKAALSVSAWVYMDTNPTATGNARIIARDDGFYVLQQWISGNSGSRFIISIITVTQDYKRWATASYYSLKEWHHVSGTWDGTNLKIYVDGVETSLSDIDGGAPGSNGSGNVEDSNTNPTRIGYVSDEYYDGKIDEVVIADKTWSAEEIAEAYRAGQGHRLNKSISSTDLTNKTKLPFYVAADRPGTYLEATVGESAYANYEADANTVGLWHLEEQTGSGAYFKDSSAYGNHGSIASAPVFVQGKIGKARNFDGVDDKVTVPDSTSLRISSTGTVDGWFKIDVTGTEMHLFSKYSVTPGYFCHTQTNNTVRCVFSIGGAHIGAVSTTALTANNWYYIAEVYDGSAVRIYINGQLEASTAVTGTIDADATSFAIGGRPPGSNANSFDGTADEVRISNTARTADDIRQAYEIGKRTHPVTIDFVSKPQAAYSSGTSVTINNPWGTTNLTDTLSVGDTMIFKENVGGTETVSQATVNTIANTTSTYGTVTLAAAPTFPTGGYSTNATVFKWQREYMDLTGPMDGHIDGSTRLTIRVLNGHEGRTVWLDDFKSASYLADNTPDSFDTATGVGTYSIAGASIASTLNRYLQIRSILSTTDTAVSPILTSSSAEFGL